MRTRCQGSCCCWLVCRSTSGPHFLPLVPEVSKTSVDNSPCPLNGQRGHCNAIRYHSLNILSDVRGHSPIVDEDMSLPAEAKSGATLRSFTIEHAVHLNCFNPFGCRIVPEQVAQTKDSSSLSLNFPFPDALLVNGPTLEGVCNSGISAPSSSSKSACFFFPPPNNDGNVWLLVGTYDRDFGGLPMKGSGKDGALGGNRRETPD